jgi:hypothetical protein
LIGTRVTCNRKLFNATRARWNTSWRLSAHLSGTDSKTPAEVSRRVALLLKAVHPEAAYLIEAWFERYDEMLAGPIQGTVDILSDLRRQGIPLYALGDWSEETFPFALKRFEFSKWV